MNIGTKTTENKETEGRFDLSVGIMILMKKSVSQALKDSLVILPGYVVLGIGFGVLMNSKGFGMMYSLLMSVFIYAGSMQYAGVDLLSSSASIITTVFMTLMVNIRHLFYGVGMLEKYKGIERHKIYDIFALTDETFSIVCSKDLKDLDKDEYCFSLSLFNHLWWISGTLIGSIAGNVLPFDFTGIDFSMTALFIVIVLSQRESDKDHLPVILTFIISFICLILFGRDDFLLPSMISIVIILSVLRKIRGDEDA